VPRLAEIQVFRPGQKDLMKPLRKANTLVVARNPKDGSFYVKDEILIRLKPGADLSDLLKLLQEQGESWSAGILNWDLQSPPAAGLGCAGPAGRD